MFQKHYGVIDMNAKKHWISWFLLTMFFVGHYFFRVTPGIINLELMKSFSLSFTDTAQLTRCFFLPYTLAQLPVGYCMSRFSTKNLITLACIMCALATFCFSQSSSFAYLCASTAFFASFAAFGFVGAVSYANANLPAEYRSLAVGLTQALGMVGGFLGMNIITQSIQIYTWQQITFITSLGLCFLALIIGFAVPSTPVLVKNVTTTANPSKEAHERSIFLQSKTWINSLYAGFIYIPFMAFVESYGMTFLPTIQQQSTEVIAFGLSLAFVGWIIGGPACGIIADRYGRTLVMKISAIAGFICSMLMLFVPMSALNLQIVLFLFGLTNTGIIGCYSISAEMHGPSQASLSISIANMTTILIGALLVPLLPRLLDLQSTPLFVDGLPMYSAADYQHTFGLVLLAPIAAYLCAALTRDTKQF
jgi:MFS family permease